MMTKTAIIIPARYNSKRLQGKPLLKVCDKPIIQWVWERAVQVKSADEVIIATDNQEILDCAKAFGANVEMTSENHKCGSDRIVEVAKRHPDFEYIINLQGDEPMINTDCVEEVIRLIKEDKTVDISTLLAPIKEDEDVDDPNMVKCVTDVSGFALYFSRSKIPYERNLGIAKFYKHIGIYGYRRDSLFKMTELEQPEMERAESLEQLRALYNGMRIKTSIVEYKAIGIDTLEDFNAFKKLVESK
ncbi:3-deoxy-manno-octulosonate cytidylyltransferase [bacterium]|nr:3-deoxy-manno-octulosonate cytidylyltransferase [bacterium]